MGLSDRNYYDNESNDPWSTDPDAWKGGSGRSKKRSIITTLIIINVAIFLLDSFTPIPKESKELYEQARQSLPAAEFKKIGKPHHWLAETLSLTPDVVQKPWLGWKLLTHGFAHAGLDSNKTFFHVGMNMLVLFFLGRPIEQKYGRNEFLRIYLLAIVISGMGWVAAQWLTGNLNSSAVGASGAVSAIVALFVFNFPKEKIYLWGVVGMPAWVVGVLVVGSDLLSSLNPASRIAWEAHLVGFAFGTAYFYMKWSFSWLDFGKAGKVLKSKPKLRIHDPGASEESLKLEADKILGKIAEHGEESLTPKERRTLNRYSKSLRKNRD